MKNSMQARPFLKWAGGKSQLIKEIDINLPEELAQGKINRYIEPFVGGGAVFLYIAQLDKVEEFFIWDINPELVLAYKTIQENVEDLIELLLKLQDKYLSFDVEERKQYFYQIRSQFNQQRQQIDFQTYHPDWVERTAHLIFLNRTCFNGLFRVNSKGEFNVPIGRYKNPKICHANNLKAVAQILQNTQIHYGDFTDSEAFVNNRSLVYFDPPYRPLSKTANFTSYSKETFDDSSQLRLRDFFRVLDQKGAKLILSNSDPKNEDLTDNFFDAAYAGYQIKRVKAKRTINSNANQRGQINELLIMNY
ncbi:MAG: DNA adenine methylase [Coleofasciculus sp. G1-WW12-02]|uniref:DNA adenine methylase n=1 Tax=Coleofasciculus sp. G1-WW12-02 TaxID=3068483 RepID=UPI0032F20564